MSAREQIEKLQQLMRASIIGQETVVQRLVIALLCNGNVLVEGLPGLAKTRAVKSMANNMEADFNRIQFTPDLLPSDVTGTEVYHQTASGGEFHFEAGPIFANLVLADEINRAPAKVQAALLEAMEERQVTVAGTSHKLPPLFMVMATQNPVEQEGTYPLPEAQMDRFIMHVLIEYPPVEDEVLVIQLVRNEEIAAAELGAEKPKKSAKSDSELVPQQAVFDARREIAAVNVAPAMERYMADLVYATRTPEVYSEELAQWIDVGASPRASLALDKTSRAHAWLAGRDYVDPQDIRAIIHDVLRHRLSLSYAAVGQGVSADKVIDTIVELVALP
ncbi:MAG: AAA family ATPase [Candidatus Pelagadaptatus aseana]|uniref:AAA family ATPase n=1 Tax=Candidatus Pelagadaptatus aseana TaxID=3120508 RepID=UPI0039B2E962